MKLTKIIKNKGTNWLNSDEFDVNQGKLSGNRVFGGLLIFAPFAIVFSCLAIILAVIGIPTSINFLKTSLFDGLNIGNKSNLHNAPTEILFEDVKSNSPYYDSLSYLKKKGIISGFEDRTFKPDQQLQRAELLKEIISAKKQFPLELNYNNCFKDVKNEWFAPAVCSAKEKGWVNGFNDQTFHPKAAVTRAEALKIFIEAFEIRDQSNKALNDFPDVQEKAWYYQYIKIAQDNGLLNQNEADLFKPDSIISRGESGQILYRILLL